jgi:hypothetical protein
VTAMPLHLHERRGHITFCNLLICLMSGVLILSGCGQSGARRTHPTQARGTADVTAKARTDTPASLVQLSVDMHATYRRLSHCYDDDVCARSATPAVTGAESALTSAFDRYMAVHPLTAAQMALTGCATSKQVLANTTCKRCA